jgi:hypothetical protein
LCNFSNWQSPPASASATEQDIVQSDEGDKPW